MTFETDVFERDVLSQGVETREERFLQRARSVGRAGVLNLHLRLTPETASPCCSGAGSEARFKLKAPLSCSESNVEIGVLSSQGQACTAPPCSPTDGGSCVTVAHLLPIRASLTRTIPIRPELHTRSSNQRASTTGRVSHPPLAVYLAAARFYHPSVLYKISQRMLSIDQ